MSSLKLKFLMAQKLLHSQGLHKIFQFQGQFAIEGQGQQFSNTSEIFRWLMNSLTVKVKFQIGFKRFKSCCIHKDLRKIFQFPGQFDFEGLGQGHQFSNPSEIFR